MWDTSLLACKSDERIQYAAGDSILGDDIDQANLSAEASPVEFDWLTIDNVHRTGSDSDISSGKFTKISTCEITKNIHKYVHDREKDILNYAKHYIY